MPSTILDAFGRPANRLGNGSSLYTRDAADNRLRPKPRNHFDDYIALLNSTNWQQLISESRAIGSRGIVAAAIMQRAEYISGSQWRPYFTGEDAIYGEEAEELLENTRTQVCTRGDRYDWRTFWKLGVMTVSPDGGFFIQLTKSPTGWPLLQPLEAHRIGQRGPSNIVEADSAWSQFTNADGEQDWKPTPYFGMTIVNGIIYSRAGAEVAFRVLGKTREDDEDISAQNMIHVAPPRWFSEGRPVPQIAPGLLDLLGVETARTAQLDAQINHSKLNLVETNDTGKQDGMRGMMNPPLSPPSESGTEIEVLERGTIRYVKKNGGKVEAHEAKVPSGEWMDYDDKALSSAIAAINWRLEMLYPGKLGGNTSRALQDAVNTIISNGFEDFHVASQRCTRYRIACYTKLKLLRPHVEFMKFAITPPPEFCVDRNAAKIDVDMVRAGADNMPNVLRRAGIRARTSLIAQAKFKADQYAIARAYGLDPDDLGTTSLPGDGNKVTTLGQAVSAGAITPSAEVEARIRDYLDIPPMGPEAVAAWKAAGVRTPITFANAQGAAPIKASPQVLSATPPPVPQE